MESSRPRRPEPPTFSVEPSNRALRRLITMSKIEPPNTRALERHVQRGTVAVRRQDAQVLEHGATAEVLRPDLVRQRGLQDEGVGDRVQRAHGRAHSRR